MHINWINCKNGLPWTKFSSIPCVFTSPQDIADKACMTLCCLLMVHIFVATVSNCHGAMAQAFAAFVKSYSKPVQHRSVMSWSKPVKHLWCYLPILNSTSAKLWFKHVQRCVMLWSKLGQNLWCHGPCLPLQYLWSNSVGMDSICVILCPSQVVLHLCKVTAQACAASVMLWSKLGQNL